MLHLLRSPSSLRLFRAGILVAIGLLVHKQAGWLETQHSTVISLRLAHKFFPAANRVQLRDPERGLHYVTDARGDTIGCLLTTSPQTDHIIGYSGPNNLIIAVNSRGIVSGVELLHSGDTVEHADRVKRDPGFFRTFIGWKPGETPFPRIAGVSGATLTSFAIAESIEERLAGAAPSLRFPDPVTLEESRALFPNAARVETERSHLRVLDATGGLLGFVLRTSPPGDNVAGWRGPTECLVALAPDRRTVTGLRVRKSYDTDAYVDQVRRAEQFLKLFIGRTIEEVATFDYPKERIEGVSGATQTARAVAEGLKRRFAGELKARAQGDPWKPKPRDWALGGVIAGALVMALTSLRGHRGTRIAWQLFLVGYVGLVNHDLLSLALFGGWMANGLALKAAPGLVLLAAAGLLTPWATRRQLYCHQICPHGAAQQLLGRMQRRRWTPPARLTRALEFVPGLLLALALLTLLLGWQISLTNLEPFDAWVWGGAASIPVVIAGVGLAASLVIPQAYCRFGCPTGAVLNFIRSTGSGDRWGRRDWAAIIFLVAGLIAVASVRAWPRVEPELEPVTLRGRTMGTTWSVKIRDEVADPGIIEKAIAGEFEWAESLTSHWRTNTGLSEFNRATTTNAIPVPWPVLTLAGRAAEISRATDGAYDITVGPLVRLWGFGPGARRREPPTDDEIAAVSRAVGWQKLEVLDGMLQKHHPALEVDLSSIAVGWAVDQVAQHLELRGYTNFLVEAGGELRALGRWTIAIEHPARACTMTNESIGTSGTYRRNFQSGGRRYSHLIDPRVGRPVAHRTVSVSARHADCAYADAWAAALNVLGVEAGLRLAERLNLAAQFVVEQANGELEVRQSAAWTARDRVTGATSEPTRQPRR